MTIEDFKNNYKYPEVKPELEFIEHGWFNGNAEGRFKELLTPETQVVVEFGTWLGTSLRSLATHAPNATVIAVDHWLGSSEHHFHEPTRLMLPTLYDQFIANCWEYRDRIIPLRADTTTAMLVLKHYNIEPDFIYLDAGHEYATVLKELHTINELFPKAIVTGDDYYSDVQKALTEYCEATGHTVKENAPFWELQK